MINGWLHHADFKAFVSEWWGKFNVQGMKAFVVKEKLKLLKEKLRVWNKEVMVGS